MDVTQIRQAPLSNKWLARLADIRPPLISITELRNSTVPMTVSGCGDPLSWQLIVYGKLTDDKLRVIRFQ